MPYFGVKSFFVMTFDIFIRIINIQMGKLKFTFPNIFLWVGIIASVLLMENVAFLTHNPSGPLSDKYFFMLVIVAALGYLAMFFFEHKMNKTKVDIVLLIVLVAFLACGLVAIWTFEDMPFTYPDDSIHVITFSSMEKVRFSIAFAFFLLTVYSALFIFAKNTITARKMIWIYIIIIIAAIVSIIYSLIKEMPEYKKLFSADNDGAINIMSFFWNPNMFSGMLIMGISSAMIINVYKRNVFSVIAILVFAIEILLICSVLSVLTIMVLIPVYFLTYIVLSFKQRPIRSTISLVSYFVIIVALVCLFAVSLNTEMGFFSHFTKYAYREVVEIDTGTFSHRTQIWEAVIKMLSDNPMKLIFGFGFGINQDVIREWCASTSGGAIMSAHNGVMQIFFNYGIVGLVIYGSFLIYFLYALIRMLRKHVFFSITFAIVALAFLGYSIGESVLFFNSNAQGMIVGILFYLPALMKYKHEKKQEVITSIKSQPYSWTTMEDSLLVKTIAIIIISFACAIVPFFFMESVKGMGFVYRALITIEICLGILWLTFPYLVYLWHSNTALIHFKVRAIINMIIIIGLLGLVSLSYLLFYRAARGTHMIVFPIAVASIMLVEIVYYSIVKKPSFKAYLATFIALFKTSIVGVIASLAVVLTLLYFFQGELDGGLLKYVIIGAFSVLVFYIFSMVIMFKDMKAIWTYIDRLEINSLYRAVLKDEREKK